MAALAPGTYLGGFFHPLLDSLGFEGEQRAVRVSAGGQRLDFGLPSPATIVEAICRSCGKRGLDRSIDRPRARHG